MDGLTEIRVINGQLAALQKEITVNFPLNEAQVTDFRQYLADKVMAVHNAEQATITCLQATMSSDIGLGLDLSRK
jgi:hypothetical protein